VPARRVLQPWHVPDQVRARLEERDELGRLLEHVALVLGAEALAGARPRRARRVRDEQPDLARSPAALRHAHQVAHVHPHRAVTRFFS
jgi:hypothetical protein